MFIAVAHLDRLQLQRILSTSSFYVHLVQYLDTDPAYMIPCGHLSDVVNPTNIDISLSTCTYVCMYICMYLPVKGQPKLIYCVHSHPGELIFNSRIKCVSGSLSSIHCISCKNNYVCVLYWYASKQCTVYQHCTISSKA